MERSRKIIILTVCFLFLIPLIRIVPFVYKGYAPHVTYEDLILARNVALTDEYKIESEKNVLLSSSSIKDKGIDSTIGNKLTVYSHALAFKIFGFNHNLPFYLSVVLYAISGVLIFLLVLKIFDNYWLAVSAFFLDLFMPFVWKGSLWAGFYEFATVFFLLGLLTYFWNKNPGVYRLLSSGMFLGLASVSRNAFLVSIIPVLIFEFYKKRSLKRVLFFALPIVFIFGLMGFVNNSYLSSEDESFTRYGHLFPDPYTYHFERESYVCSVTGSEDPEIAQFMLQYGYDVSFASKIKMYFNSAVFYIKQLFSLINFGGPFFLFLGILGAVFLYKNKREILQFFGIWLVFWYLSLVALKTNNWDHFLEIRFVLVVLITYGAWVIAKYSSKFFEKEKIRFLFVSLFVLFLSLQLFASNKWFFHDAYSNKGYEEIFETIDLINEQEVGENEVIAISFHQNTPLILNYFTDKNFVFFDPETIEKLKQEERLEDVFKEFGVTRYIEF